MTIFNGTKSLDDFIPWPDDPRANRPAKVKGLSRKSKQQSRPQEIWRPEYETFIRKMTTAGMGARAIAEILGVRFSVFEEWAKTNYACQRAIAKGKVGVKLIVADALLLKAIGQNVPTEKVFYNSRTGKVARVQTTTYYPPDTQAALAFLNRRDPGEPMPFAPPSRVEHTGPNGEPLDIGDSVEYKTLMLLGSSPDDQRKAASLYQQIIKGNLTPAKPEPDKEAK